MSGDLKLYYLLKAFVRRHLRVQPDGRLVPMKREEIGRLKSNRLRSS
jgi:hypothetical protein